MKFPSPTPQTTSYTEIPALSGHVIRTALLGLALVGLVLLGLLYFLQRRATHSSELSNPAPDHATYTSPAASTVAIANLVKSHPAA